MMKGHKLNEVICSRIHQMELFNWQKQRAYASYPSTELCLQEGIVSFNSVNLAQMSTSMVKSYSMISPMMW